MSKLLSSQGSFSVSAHSVQWGFKPFPYKLKIDLRILLILLGQLLRSLKNERRSLTPMGGFPTLSFISTPTLKTHFLSTSTIYRNNFTLTIIKSKFLSKHPYHLYYKFWASKPFFSFLIQRQCLEEGYLREALVLIVFSGGFKPFPIN